MKKTLFKKAVVLAMALFVLTPVMTFSLPAMAEDLNPWGTDTLKDNIQTTTGLGERDPRDIAASVIRVILGFLGIIAVIIILLGGFKWMTAGGNEDKVGEAKKLITAGIIGLVIILAAFAIATFVLNSLLSATTDV
ncbi:MAG: pilin [bacterium]|nr:pilin [bacterium]